MGRKKGEIAGMRADIDDPIGVVAKRGDEGAAGWLINTMLEASQGDAVVAVTKQHLECCAGHRRGGYKSCECRQGQKLTQGARQSARRDQSLAFGDGAAVARGAVHEVTIKGWSTRRQSAVESVRESRTNARSLVLRSPLALHTANSGR